MHVQTRKGIGTGAIIAVIVIIIVIAGGAYYFIASSGSGSSTTTTTTAPPPTTTTTTATTLPGKGMSIGVVFDVGGLGDRGFNDLAHAGMIQANQTLGMDYDYRVATSTSQIPSLFASLINEHLTLIVGVGFDDDGAIAQYAQQYPNQKFAQIDGDIYNMTNVVAIKFTEHVGSAVVGALAAVMAGNGQKVGFLGGVATGIIFKFWNGYKYGVSWADQYMTKLTGSTYNNTLDEVYDTPAGNFAGFNDVPGGYSNGQAMIARGDKVIFTAAGGTGIGTFNAIGQYDQQQGWNWSNSSSPKVWAIGVDANQDYYGTQQYFSAAQQNKTASNLTPPSFILTSEIKKVDYGVFKVASWVVAGNYSALWGEANQVAPSFMNGQSQVCGQYSSDPCINQHNVYLLGLKQGAVGPTNFQYTSQFLSSNAKLVLAQITEGILNGSIHVPEVYTDTGT